MGKTVQDNIANLEVALSEVKAHCMTLRFQEDEYYFTVIFPEGYFPNGVRASKGLGKIKALKLLLEKLEYYWMSSFPGYINEK